MFWKDNLVKIIYTVIILLVIIILILIFRTVLNRPLKRRKIHSKRAQTITKLLKSFFQYTIIILGILGILSVWGIDVKPFLAGAGILGLAIGFGAQDLVKDLVSGFFIILDNYYDVGDIIEIKEFKGEVVEIGLRTTRIVNWKGDLKIFANREITEVINYSKFNSTAIVHFKVSYTENLEFIYQLVEQALNDIEEKYSQIITKPQIVGVTSLEDDGVVIRITAKTKPETHYEVERGINKRIKDVFEKNKIQVAFKHVVVAYKEGEE
ncbi:MAG: mechanosensitive ion channel family protein [Acholeplasmataceae bacterium]|nr:mechanosensitive ion channel family protein [Acholeplasmataceae bacterium]HOA63466.1 mechanosensitive ion channel family protein [Bacilli bacterium]HPT89590.1 mechanosensitive ion channel family protein [Bacilli bacterium]HQA19231.1 mechanosensitive ion channel family protein [Bacilli bacterium]HQD91657.1 mechanosensitive ion channel family protein [Bacilli bacterium]